MVNFAREVWDGYSIWERVLLIVCLVVIVFCIGWRINRPAESGTPFFREVGSVPNTPAPDVNGLSR